MSAILIVFCVLCILVALLFIATAKLDARNRRQKYAGNRDDFIVHHKGKERIGK